MTTVQGITNRPATTRYLLAAWLGVIIIASVTCANEPAVVTTRKDAVGKLLNAWFSEGTAAGLAGIQYENRDNGHSLLPLSEYPQLKIYQASEEEKAKKKDVALMDSIRDLPTVGNCSMAAPVESGGSIPRHYMLQPSGSLFLARQYLANQLYVYPEHYDYDPGFNGIGGYGDVYPINAPSFIISQGSSFTDMPFVKAVLSTIAAFPTDTQRILINKRLLMPTVQSIFRHSNHQVKTEEDYFTGKAHPPVFKGDQLDEEKMISAAHTMLPAAIPPVALLRVLEEIPMESGKNYFEDVTAPSYKLSDSPVAIGRIFRGNVDTYDMIVSADKSVEPSGKPIQLRWHLLQGDPRLIRMELDKNGTVARIRVRWSPPIMIAPGMQSHRIDIGVFASNGLNVSAPAMISFFMLPNEMRFYDDKGHLAEICYQAHNPDIGLPLTDTDPRWVDVFSAMSAKSEPITASLIEQLIGTLGRDAMRTAWEKLDPTLQTLKRLDADPNSKDEAAKARSAFETALVSLLEEKIPAGKQSLSRKMAALAVFNALADTTDLYPQFQGPLAALATRSSAPDAVGTLQREVDRLKGLGVLIQTAENTIQIAKAPEMRTAADRYYLRGLNLTILSKILFPSALKRSEKPAFADPRLTTSKPWRDVFIYNKESGDRRGWLRYTNGRTAWFNNQGQLLPDGPGGTAAPQTVRYEKASESGLTFRGQN